MENNIPHFSDKFIKTVNEFIKERKAMNTINFNPKRPNSRIRRRNANGYFGKGTDSGWRKNPANIGKRELPEVDRINNSRYNSIIKSFYSLSCKFSFHRGYLGSKHYGSKPLGLLLRHLKDDYKTSRK